MCKGREILEAPNSMAKDIENMKGAEQYDAVCKRVLSQKSILAWIMKSCLREYRDESIENIRDCYIEGTPQVASVPVERDETNVSEHIIGDNAEDTSRTEGKTLYDIIFTALIPGTSESVYLIINVEAQGSSELSYPLIKRGIYYAGRILTAENGRYFVSSHYEDIRKVYSIWVCMNPQLERANTIVEYRIERMPMEGDFSEKLTDYDLMTVVMINVGRDNHQKAKSLLRLLRIVFAKDMTPQEKKISLAGDYELPMTEEIQKGMSEMCNLSKALIEEGIEKGSAAATSDIIARMLSERTPIPFIMKVCHATMDTIKKVAGERGLAMDY